MSASIDLGQQVAWVGLVVGSGVLVVSGVLKLIHPSSVVPLLAVLHVPRLLQRGRAVGFSEVVLGVVAGMTSYRPAVLAEAGLYVGFALIISYVLVARVPLASCGCTGSSNTPPNVLHVLVNVLAAIAAFGAASAGTPSFRDVWSELGWSGPVVAAGVVAAVSLTMFVMGPLAELLQACVRVRAAGLVYQPPSRSEMAV